MCVCNTGAAVIHVHVCPSCAIRQPRHSCQPYNLCASERLRVCVCARVHVCRPLNIQQVFSPSARRPTCVTNHSLPWQPWTSLTALVCGRVSLGVKYDSSFWHQSGYPHTSARETPTHASLSLSLTPSPFIIPLFSPCLSPASSYLCDFHSHIHLLRVFFLC